MSLVSRNRLARAGAAMLLVALLAGMTGPLSSAGEPAAVFQRENDTAMRVMMERMHVAPTGDVDRDFVTMMIPHHQGAIDMAELQLRYGKDEALKRLSREIIQKQKEEIAMMERMLAAMPAATVPAQQEGQQQGHHDSHHAH